MEKINNIIHQWDEIQSKMDELQELRKKLNCSLAIQSLWPEAFQSEEVTSLFVGNTRRIRDMIFRIISKNQYKDFNILSIPKILIERQIEVQLDKAKGEINKDIWVRFKREFYMLKKFNNQSKEV
jgi:hypothetical protein